jgi:hypothetical protein
LPSNRPLAQVGEQLFGGDDRLGLERHRRAGDPRDRAQHLGDRVHLGLSLAVGAHPFPHERQRVQPEHLDALVGQEGDDLGELEQHSGIGPVDVPLPGVERGPDPRLASSSSQVKLPGAKSGNTSGRLAS